MNRDEFVVVVRALERDFADNGDAWENTTLDTFLEALGAWVQDCGRCFANRGQATPDVDWTLFAAALQAAVMYE